MVAVRVGKGKVETCQNTMSLSFANNPLENLSSAPVLMCRWWFLQGGWHVSWFATSYLETLVPGAFSSRPVNGYKFLKPFYHFGNRIIGSISIAKADVRQESTAGLEGHQTLFCVTSRWVLVTNQ